MTDINDKLTPRMKMVLSMVPESKCCCDVGTDHGYLAIALAKNGIKTIAMDVNKGPLSAAEKNLRFYGADAEVRLSDGFSALNEGEADCAVIAGMGGELIADIIKKGTKGVGKLVLQPQSLIYELREYITENGFTITDEDICCEGNRFYTVILAEKGISPKLSEEQKRLGPVLLKKRPDVLKAFIKKEVEKLERNLGRIELAGAVTQNSDEYRQLINLYKKVLNEKW